MLDKLKIFLALAFFGIGCSNVHQKSFSFGERSAWSVKILNSEKK